MYFVEENIKTIKSNSNDEIITNLYRAYAKIGYSPEFYDDNTLVIKTPVEFIVSFVDNKAPVSLTRLHRMWTPLKEISEFTGIKNYIIISKQGFKEECYSVEGYAVRLETMNYVKSILKANPSNKPLELMPHNHLAFKNLMTMWKTERFASIVHATGTGKSFIISKVLQSYRKESVILVCPTVYILDQFKELFSKFGILSNRIDFVTYSKLSQMTNSELDSSNYDLIILDELHRAGAKRWGAGVKRIIYKNENAKVLGVTATPIRYLDDRRDMTEELLEGNVASSLDLFEAMGRGILPTPKYIEALYDISSDISFLENSVKKSSSSTINKNDLLESIRRFKVSWNSVHSIKNIIRKHFSPDVKRIIVFCKNVSHLKEINPLIKEWFTLSKVYNNINIFEAYSSSEEGFKDELDLFKEPVYKGDVNILLSVDKLNEGVHVEGVDSVIFLRNSQSQNIILQQIGRALSATSNTDPIILDLINNIEVLGSQSFYAKLNSAIANFEDKKTRLNLIQEPIAPIDFDVLDETKDFISFMKETLGKISKSWDDYLKDAVKCKKKTGWFPGPKTPDEDENLIKWVTVQRHRIVNNVISENKLAKLNQVGFISTFTKEKWLYMYNRLLDYKADNNIDSFFRHVITDNELRLWVIKQRRRYQLNKMEDDEKNLLVAAGISLNPYDDLWDYYIKRLQEFYDKYGHKNPSEGEDKELCIFAREQRRRKMRGTLSKNKIDSLNSINFIWESQDTSITFDERVEQLKEYIKTNGDAYIVTSYKGFDNLGQWARVMRTKKSKGTLPENKIKTLDKLGFCWDQNSYNLTRQINDVIEYTKAKKIDNTLLGSKSTHEAILKLRNKYKKGELSSDEIQRLEAVGFNWTPTSDTWNKRINQLKEYYSLYGTFKISGKTGFHDYHQLSTWLKRQKDFYNNNKLPVERQKELESIGFDFNKEYTFKKSKESL